VQDEITEVVTIAIVPAIADAEQQRAIRRPSASLDAWAAYQQGLWHLGKANAEKNALAEKCFQRAIDLDPIFVGGSTGLASVINRASAMFLTRNLAAALSAEEALAAARGRAR
jgi:adenylate cyclase